MPNRPPLRAARDLNEAAIIDELQRIPGVRVLRLDTPCDLLVGFRHRVYLLEVKALKGKLTKAQLEFHLRWKGYVSIVRSPAEARAAIGVG